MAGFTSLKIILSNALLLWLALIVLIIPIRFLIALMISAIIHEFGHVLMLKLFGIKIRQIQISLFGARIFTDSMECYQELLCAAAGPLASFGVLLFSRYAPFVSVCSFFHGVVNLFPIGNLDGARVLRCILHMIMQDHFAEKIFLWLSRICILCLLFAVALIAMRSKRIILLIIPVLLFLRKSPCNASAERVQYR